MSNSPAFCVALVKDRKLQLSPAQQKIINSYLTNHEGKNVRVTLSQPTKTRSNSQNSYYWSVPLTMIAAETGHTTEEIHEYLKDLLLPRVNVSINGKNRELPKSTTTLDTFFFEQYLEAVRAFAATELNMTIPLPNEVDS